jgi:hypothetical protein
MDDSEDASSIRTIFCSGFPLDVQYREIYNLFRFTDGYESCMLSLKGKVPIAFATFKDHATALSEIARLGGLKFDPDSNMELRAQLARSNSTNTDQRKARVITPGGSRKRPREDLMGRHGIPPSFGPPQFDLFPPPHLNPQFPPHQPHPIHHPAPRPQQQQGDVTTLFIANLGVDTTEEELQSVFGSLPGYGRMKLKATKDGRPPVAFVEFHSRHTCNQALAKLNGHVLPSSGMGMRVEKAQKQMGTSSAGSSNGRGGFQNFPDSGWSGPDPYHRGW